MRADLFVKRTEQRLVLIGTFWRTRRRQITRRIGELFFVRAERQTQEILETLLGQAMITREGGCPRLHHGIPLVITQICPPGPRSAANQSPRLSSAKLQHGVRCKVVGGILLTSKYWDAEDIERCVSNLMQGHEKNCPTAASAGVTPAGVVWFGKESNMFFKSS